SASTDHTVKLWDVKQRRLKKTLIGHTASVNCLAFSPDGTFLSTASDDGSVTLWDAGSWQVVTSWQATNSLGWNPRHLSFSPRESFLACAHGGGPVTLWDFSTRQPLTELPESCNRVAFSPDGQTLIAGSYNAINFWDIDTAAKLRSVAQKGSTISLAVSLKGNKLAASTHLTLKVFDLSDLGRFVTLTGFEPR